MKTNKAKVLLLSSAIATTLLVGCGQQQEQQKSVETVRPVEVYKVKPASALTTWKFPATVAAYKSTDLAFNSGGKLIEFNITQGQRVKKGQLLASVDPRDYKIQLESVRANYTQAKNAYNRGQQLIKNSTISKNDFEQLESQYKVAKSQFESAEKSLKDTKLYAPYDGAISSTSVQNHDTVAGGQSIISLIDSSKYSAKFDISADRLNYLKKREPKGANVVFNTFNNERAAADFKEISLLPSSNQSYEVTLSFTPPTDIAVLPGMSVQVQIENDSASSAKAMFVPTKAVISTGKETYVWKVDSQTMTAHKQDIILSNSIGEFVTVASGLKGGDQIITAGAPYAVEGMKVSIWQQGK
ncbi:efflux RND transporter periplasmic adaptor subunit [Parashewanella spongiae]|uniref:Efflux RND transporter periplasmic adaptor subunit n=1 Tax=Parashewanella spongiae TaxID=342950 RepID=A0A3A6TCV3_9GAMM|nr:efflux RND transporter periplasmic adaptor subunit [Parashewanella spongiae]MCL1080035.1 efflux RND transporter periplasmic adaptor subunit [Parashewanella spongiae]RJY05837.1 efflux RND transporter periplasmic adaptor subunit [Parashewanella spongiae]